MKSWILYVVVLFSYAEADHNPCEELAGDVSGQVTGSGFHLLTPAVREIREGETYRGMRVWSRISRKILCLYLFLLNTFFSGTCWNERSFCALHSSSERQ